jgi:hypothetical protein
LIRLVRESPEPDRRAAALHALWLLRDKRATEVCLRVGANLAASGEERLIAVEALGISAHRRHVQQALIRFLIDPLPKVRYSALCAIGAARTRVYPMGQELREALQKATKDPTSLYEAGDVARFAAELLTPPKIGTFGVPGSSV